MDEGFIKPKHAFSILILIALARGVLYSIAVPPWQHPDEPTHFEHVRFIAETNRLPTAEDFSIPLRWEIAESMLRAGFWELHTTRPLTDENMSNPGGSPLGIYTFTHPRLYYILAGIWLKPWLSFPVEVQLFVTRLLSVVFNLVILACAYLSCKVLFPTRNWLPLSVAWFIAFHPVQTDMMSAVNNDALINAIGALFFTLTVMVFKKGMSFVKLGLLLLLIVLGVFTKTTVITLIAVVPIGIVLYLWRMDHKTLALAMIFIAFSLLLATVVLNQIEGVDEIIQSGVDTLGRYLRVNIGRTIEGLTRPERQILFVNAMPVVFQSFWAVFGWRSVWVSPILYWIAAMLCVISAAGLIRLAYNWSRRKTWRPRTTFRPTYLTFAALSIVVAIFITLTRSLMVQGLRAYLSHGRYFLVAMVPFSILFVLGLSNWVPERGLKYAGIAFGLLMLLFDAVSFWGFLVPAYY